MGNAQKDKQKSRQEETKNGFNSLVGPWKYLIIFHAHRPKPKLPIVWCIASCLKGRKVC